MNPVQNWALFCYTGQQFLSARKLAIGVADLPSDWLLDHSIYAADLNDIATA